jgi:heat shock protein HslJ
MANDGGELVAVDDGHRQPGLAFDESRSVAGSTGCNNFMGSCALDGPMLELGPLATTLMMCQEAAMTQERMILTALASARRWSIDGDRLTLWDGLSHNSDPDGSALLVCAAAT